MTAVPLPTVRIRGIDVADAPMEDVVRALRPAPEGPLLAFALHVGGLNAAADPAVRDAYACADVTYADGIAVVLLGRLAGGTSIDRAPTTDLGPALFNSPVAGPPRVFLIGGPDGLADAAGRRLVRDHGVTVVGAMNGYDVDPDDFLARLREARPTVVLVGLGSPREMFFLARLRERLPAALYLTCGGWFGFLAGHEDRAPEVLRRWGLEWVWRLKQDPRRLVGRYARGVWTTLLLAAVLLGRSADPAPPPPPAADAGDAEALPVRA